MTVNSYLRAMSAKAIVRDVERQRIAKTIRALGSRLTNYFSTEIAKQFVFGSYTRGTILPRYMDPRSDIDYMVVFRDGGLQPQSYLSRLRGFVENSYSRSEVFQSHPTIVLSLEHIQVELVPAIHSFFFGFQIPARSAEPTEWISTNPTSFDQKLRESNRENGNLIKPTIRLVKYWNARKGYVFPSYELEEKIVDTSYLFVGGLLGEGRLRDYFFTAMESLETELFSARWRSDAVSQAHDLVGRVRHCQRNRMEDAAEEVLRRLIPPV